MYGALVEVAISVLLAVLHWTLHDPIFALVAPIHLPFDGIEPTRLVHA